MPDNESDYQVDPGRRQLHTRFRKGQSGNPGGRSAKTLPALLAAALDEKVYVTTNGRRRKLTKREAIITQMVDKSASADLRATKMLIDMIKDTGHKAGAAKPPPEPRPLADADNEVVQLIVVRLRRQILSGNRGRKDHGAARIASPGRSAAAGSGERYDRLAEAAERAKRSLGSRLPLRHRASWCPRRARKRFSKR